MSETETYEIPEVSALEIAGRIDRRLKKLGLSAREASHRATGSYGAIPNIIRGRMPGGDVVTALAVVLGTTEQWLLREEGPEEPGVTPNFRLAPLIEWSTVATLADPETPTPTEDVRLLGIEDFGRGDYFAVHMDDDAMDRIAPKGALVIADRSQRTIQDGKPGIILSGFVPMMRRWRADPPRWEPFSTNPSHEPIYGPVTVIARVRRTVSDL